MIALLTKTQKYLQQNMAQINMLEVHLSSTQGPIVCKTLLKKTNP